MDAKKEATYLFDKKMECYVCGREFTTKQIRTGKIRFVGTDDILKPLYTGIDSTKYDIMMCPYCGYAATQRTYGHMTAKQRQDIQEYIGGRFNIKISESETYSYDTAIRRCKMALLTEMVMKGKVSESAYICLRLAWLYRGYIEQLREEGVSETDIEEKVKAEKEYIMDAYKGFKEAMEKEYPPMCGMDEMTINYLLTSLAVECNEYSEAKQFAGKIITSRSANAKLKEKTRTLMEQIK